MAYQKVKQAKLSDVIEQELEKLIIEGTLAPGQQLLPERELAKQFGVSRPSIREAIQRLEAKKLLIRRQGDGTFVSQDNWQHFSDPLLELLSAHPETQLDLLEARHALEGLCAYFAALRGTDTDFIRIKTCHDRIVAAGLNIKAEEYHNQDIDYQRDNVVSRDLMIEQQAAEVISFLIALTEAAHNVVLLHIIRSLSPLLQHNIARNLKLLHRREDVVKRVSKHRASIMEAVISGQPEKAREMSYSHLAYIEETLLELNREESRHKRSLRRLQQNNS